MPTDYQVSGFFLSPWEFVQWFKVHRVREPCEEYDWSKWTSEGKRKLKRRRAGEKNIQMKPFEDYVLHEKNIQNIEYLFPYPEETVLFDKRVPDGYKEFRNTWIIIRRERPAVPCPVQTPLPGKRMTKERRAVLFSVYLRPWTLSLKAASQFVPHVGNVDDARCNVDPASPTTVKCIRQAWKAYTLNLLPHAARQISNFMLACLAEGRGHDREDEEAVKRGGAVICELTQQEITAIMNRSREYDKQSAEQEPLAGPHFRSANDEANKGHGKRIAATTSLALQLADASKSNDQKLSIGVQSLVKNQLKASSVSKADDTLADAEVNDCFITRHTHDWQAAYSQWFADLTNKTLQKNIVPNPKQLEILRVVHHRCVLEWETKMRSYSSEAGNSTSEPVSVEAPLLRLVHGLPGSGKSQVLDWMRSYPTASRICMSGRFRMKIMFFRQTSTTRRIYKIIV